MKTVTFSRPTLGRPMLGVLALAALLFARPSHAATEVVASIPELAAVTKAVGGENVSVYSVAKPRQDYHRVEARPSDVARVAKADLVVRSGLALDSWLDALMNAAGNRNLNRGGEGYVNASEGIPIIERPDSSITGASGDVHAEGNPHYLYDPIYAKFAARNILRGLIRVDAKNADEYRKNYLAFNAKIDANMARWKAALAPFAGKPIVTYHRNYNYFLRRFGLRQFGTLEAIPGIPPTAKHISALMASMKRDDVRAILVEEIYSKRFPDLMSRQLGVKYAVAPCSVDALTGDSYIALINELVSKTKSVLD